MISVSTGSLYSAHQPARKGIQANKEAENQSVHQVCDGIMGKLLYLCRQLVSRSINLKCFL